MGLALPVLAEPPVAPSRAVAPARKPSWLKVRAPGGANYAAIRGLMRELGLHTVCEEARCPNIGECWEHKAATFMILGDVCTRNCTYCAVAHGTPQPFDPVEPVRLADAVARMGLQHVVITSVDRDDLPNGGAEAFAGCITEIRARLPQTTVEVLIPDFKGSERALQLVMDARPDILNHNLETAERLYRLARPGGRYDRALELLARARRMVPDGLTKSGVILGMGEEWDEVVQCMRDLRRSDVNILTLGQYLRPTDGHLPVARYYTPDEFAELAAIGERLGFSHVQASPLTRSSYHAWEQAAAAGGRPERSEGPGGPRSTSGQGA
ncbi:MAG: lipoyl synthase [Gemmatimonadales bacterium]|nr:lipoyl synthase [Gemmatimonadales bacterium]